jgi:hypothetical protein
MPHGFLMMMEAPYFGYGDHRPKLGLPWHKGKSDADADLLR